MSKELLKKIEAFLDKGQITSDGGWAEVSRDDKDEINDIIAALIDARIARDADGDQTIVPYLVDRKIGYMPGIMIPYMPNSLGDLDAEALLNISAERYSIAHYYSGVASDVLRSCQIVTDMAAALEKKNKENKQKIDEFYKRWLSDDWSSLAEDWIAFRRDFNDYAALAPVFDVIERRFATEIDNTINGFMERLNACVDDESDEFPSWEERRRATLLWGPRLAGAIKPLSDELYRKGVARRKAARMAMAASKK